MRFSCFFLLFLLLFASYAKPLPVISLPNDELISTQSQNIFDLDYVEPIYAENPKLRKIVSLSFYDITLSEIMLILSRVGGFDYVLPTEHDPTLTIDIKNKTVYEAIEVIMNITRLKKKFQHNTLTLSRFNEINTNFYTIPIRFVSLEQLVAVMNSHFIKSEDEYAFINKPNSELILAAEAINFAHYQALISRLDTNEAVKLWTAQSTSPEKLRKQVHSKYSTLSITIDRDQLIMRGKGLDLFMAHEFLKNNDAKINSADFHIEIGLRSRRLKRKQRYLIESRLPKGRFVELGSDYVQSTDFYKIGQLLSIQKSIDITTKNDSYIDIDGINMHLGKISHSRVAVEINDKNFIASTDSLVVYCDEAYKLFEFTKIPERNYKDLVCVFIRNIKN